MTDETDKESAGQLLNPRASAAPVDRASESVVSSNGDEGEGKVWARAISPVSSGEIELPPDSLKPSTPSQEPGSLPPPPSAVVANAMGRGRTTLPLSTMVWMGFGIFVVLILLSLLLFR